MRYFIVVRKDIANPYSAENIAHTKSEFWSSYNDDGEPRKNAEVYATIQKGDKILCYSGVEKVICAILEAGEKDSEGITMKFQTALNIPLESIKAHYETLLELSPEKYSPFSSDKSNIFFGTFFEASEAQFYYLCGLHFERLNLKKEN